MKMLVIPDIHLKPRLFDRAETILRTGRADRAVCLMDIPDDWDMQSRIDLYEKTFDRAIRFAETFPDTLWCYGNHDVSYPWGQLESGYSSYAESTVIAKLEELRRALPDERQLAFVHRVGCVLFSHGGLASDFVRLLGLDPDTADPDAVIRAVNNAPANLLWDDISPLWLRPQEDAPEMFRDDEFRQVVGHTPVEKIYKKHGVLSTDVFSTYRNGTQIGESVMAVIDTETGMYEKIPVRD